MILVGHLLGWSEAAGGGRGLADARRWSGTSGEDVPSSPSAIPAWLLGPAIGTWAEWDSRRGRGCICRGPAG